MICLKIHIVQKGDTLWEIAKKYNVDFEEMKQINSQLSSPDMIMPGMKVKIPSSTKVVKKESKVPKEKQKSHLEHPYKDISPKPLPTIAEDDHKKPKEVKVEKPKMDLSKKPEMPKMEMPQMPMPELQEHELQTTPNNYPEVQQEPQFPKGEMPLQDQQMMFQPIPVQIIPVCCCHMKNPCHAGAYHAHFSENMGGGPPHPYHHMPMQQVMHSADKGNFEYYDCPSPSIEMGVKPGYPKYENHYDCMDHQYHPLNFPIHTNPVEVQHGYPFRPVSHASYFEPDYLHEPQSWYDSDHPNHMYPTPPEFPGSGLDPQRDKDNSKGE